LDGYDRLDCSKDERDYFYAISLFFFKKFKKAGLFYSFTFYITLNFCSYLVSPSTPNFSSKVFSRLAFGEFSLELLQSCNF